MNQEGRSHMRGFAGVAGRDAGDCWPGPGPCSSPGRGCHWLSLEDPVPVPKGPDSCPCWGSIWKAVWWVPKGSPKTGRAQAPFLVHLCFFKRTKAFVTQWLSCCLDEGLALPRVPENLPQALSSRETMESARPFIPFSI